MTQVPNERRLVGSSVSIDQAVEGTPYERVLRLTRRIVDGAKTDYAAVTRIQAFLVANYAYDQDVPLSEDPIPAFLFEDRAGYCQQFSGAMALMLRMSGIPARVVSGFAPGVPQAGGTYSVSDTDAHSWVEVLYPGIGWVTVDPTPGQTPAHTNFLAPGSERGATAIDRDLVRAVADSDQLGRGLRGTQQGPSTVGDDGGSPVPLIGFLVLAGGGAGVVIRRRRRMRSPQGAELQLRELRDALEATGREAFARRNSPRDPEPPVASRRPRCRPLRRGAPREPLRPAPPQPAGPRRAPLFPLGTRAALRAPRLVEGAARGPAGRPQGLRGTTHAGADPKRGV